MKNIKNMQEVKESKLVYLIILIMMAARYVDHENIGNFIRALEQQVKNTGIGDFELSLDFKPDNIMSWNGNLVMVDW